MSQTGANGENGPPSSATHPNPPPAFASHGTPADMPGLPHGQPPLSADTIASVQPPMPQPPNADQLFLQQQQTNQLLQNLIKTVENMGIQIAAQTSTTDKRLAEMEAKIDECNKKQEETIKKQNLRIQCLEREVTRLNEKADVIWK